MPVPPRPKPPTKKQRILEALEAARHHPHSRRRTLLRDIGRQFGRNYVRQIICETPVLANITPPTKRERIWYRLRAVKGKPRERRLARLVRLRKAYGKGSVNLVIIGEPMFKGFKGLAFHHTNVLTRLTADQKQKVVEVYRGSRSAEDAAARLRKEGVAIDREGISLVLAEAGIPERHRSSRFPRAYKAPVTQAIIDGLLALKGKPPEEILAGRRALEKTHGKQRVLNVISSYGKESGLGFARVRGLRPRTPRNALSLDERRAIAQQHHAVIRRACASVLRANNRLNELDGRTTALTEIVAQELAFVDIQTVRSLPGIVHAVASRKLIDLGRQEKWVIKKGRRQKAMRSLDVPTEREEALVAGVAARTEWPEMTAERIDELARVAGLKPKEKDVLKGLSAGEPGVSIAARLRLTEGRISQIKSELARKLAPHLMAE